MKRLILVLAVVLLFPWTAWGVSLSGTTLAGTSAEGVGGGVASNYVTDVNCMGAWYMNNDGGNETDRSGEGETLTQTSGTIPTDATVPSGYAGTSRDFEKADTEYLMHADGGSTDISGANQPIAMCAWIKFEADPGADAFIIQKWEGSGHRQYRLFHDDGENAMRFSLSNSGGNSETRCIGATDLADDTNWHHVCGTYDGATMRVYVDGSLDTSVANPLAHDNTIGALDPEFKVGYQFDGLMDEVIIFDRNLSAAEVTAIYTDGIDGTKGGTD